MRPAAQTVRFQPLRLAVVLEPPLMFAEHTDQTMKHLGGHDIPSKGRPNDRSVLHLFRCMGTAICQAVLACAIWLGEPFGTTAPPCSACHPAGYGRHLRNIAGELPSMTSTCHPW